MRNLMIVMSALALTAAAPVAAQNTDDTLNATAEPAANTEAGTDNAIVTTDPAIAGTANDLAAAPVTLDQPIDMAESEPASAPARKGGFPWGAVGLLGLLGLIGRKNAR